MESIFLLQPLAVMKSSAIISAEFEPRLQPKAEDLEATFQPKAETNPSAEISRSPVLQPKAEAQQSEAKASLNK